MAGGRLLAFEKLGPDWVAWYRQIAWLLKQDTSGQWYIARLEKGDKAFTRLPGPTFATVGDAAVHARILANTKARKS